MSKQIPLSGKCGRGLYAIVDDDDYEWLSQYSWRTSSIGYAFRYVRKTKGTKGRNIYMHREIMKCDEKTKIVDHINHKILDNRKSNLRICTASQNQQNKMKGRGNFVSKFKGVCYLPKKHGWKASIKVNEKAIVRGVYRDELIAAAIYNKLAIIYHGEFACLNEFTDDEKKKIQEIGYDNIFVDRQKTSKYMGVSAVSGKPGTYRWRFSHNGKRYSKRPFNSQEDARDDLISFLKSFPGDPFIKHYYKEDLMGIYEGALDE